MPFVEFCYHGEKDRKPKRILCLDVRPEADKSCAIVKSIKFSYGDTPRFYIHPAPNTTCSEIFKDKKICDRFLKNTDEQKITTILIGHKGIPEVKLEIPWAHPFLNSKNAKCPVLSFHLLHHRGLKELLVVSLTLDGERFTSHGALGFKKLPFREFLNRGIDTPYTLSLREEQIKWELLYRGVPVPEGKDTLDASLRAKQNDDYKYSAIFDINEMQSDLENIEYKLGLWIEKPPAYHEMKPLYEKSTLATSLQAYSDTKYPLRLNPLTSARGLDRLQLVPLNYENTGHFELFQLHIAEDPRPDSEKQEIGTDTNSVSILNWLIALRLPTSAAAEQIEELSITTGKYPVYNTVRRFWNIAEMALDGQLLMPASVLNMLSYEHFVSAINQVEGFTPYNAIPAGMWQWNETCSRKNFRWWLRFCHRGRAQGSNNGATAEAKPRTRLDALVAPTQINFFNKPESAANNVKKKNQPDDPSKTSNNNTFISTLVDSGMQIWKGGALKQKIATTLLGTDAARLVGGGNEEKNKQEDEMCNTEETNAIISTLVMPGMQTWKGEALKRQVAATFFDTGALWPVEVKDDKKGDIKLDFKSLSSSIRISFDVNEDFQVGSRQLDLKEEETKTSSMSEAVIQGTLNLEQGKNYFTFSDESKRGFFDPQRAPYRMFFGECIKQEEITIFTVEFEHPQAVKSLSIEGIGLYRNSRGNPLAIIENSGPANSFKITAEKIQPDGTELTDEEDVPIESFQWHDNYDLNSLPACETYEFEFGNQNNSPKDKKKYYKRIHFKFGGGAAPFSLFFRRFTIRAWIPDQRVRFGGIDLYFEHAAVHDPFDSKKRLASFSDKPKAESKKWSTVRFFEKKRNRDEPATLGIDSSIALSCSGFSPATTDLAVETDVVSQEVAPDPTIFIPLEQTIFPNLIIRMRERTYDGSPRESQADLELEGQKWPKIDLLYFDTTPFNFARVTKTFSKLPNKKVIATYYNTSERAPYWQFATGDENSTDIYLPPQGVEDEAVKNLRLVEMKPTENPRFDHLPDPDNPFDFRLTPPAKVRLQLSERLENRPVAPWNLRRLLGSNFRGETGTNLLKLDLELLYGLSIMIQQHPSRLRLAEMEGFYGRFPLHPDLESAMKSNPVEGDGADYGETNDPPRIRYVKKLRSWYRALRKRSSIYRPFSDINDRKPLLLTEGLRQRVRPTRLTANPFSLSQEASPPGQEQKRKYASESKFDPFVPKNGKEREALRGGFDYFFQSSNIYDKVINQPEAVGGMLEGLELTPFGGSGFQRAEYDGGKSIILATSVQGRRQSVTIIRLGRIAVYWNRARHVIRYERTVRNPDRYAKLNERKYNFDGVAALRKVREYIEITQPRRPFAEEGKKALNGACRSLVFGTTIIDVKADWGRDFELKSQSGVLLVQGWLMPLRGPVTGTEKKFYPEPDIFAGFGLATGSGERETLEPIANVVDLAFFTSTLDRDGKDTDTWPAYPEIDRPLYVSLQHTDLLPFEPENHERQLPDAPEIETGLEPYTLRLKRAAQDVNITEGIAEKITKVALNNVSLIRGSLLEKKFEDPNVKKLFTIFKKLRDYEIIICDYLDRGINASDNVRNEITKLRNDFCSILSGITESLIKDAREALKDYANRQVDTYYASARSILDSEWKRLKKEFSDSIGTGKLDEVKQTASELLLQALSSARLAVQALRTIPEEFYSALHTARDQVCHWLEETIDAIGLQLSVEFDRIRILGLETLDKLKDALDKAQDRIESILITIKERVMGYFRDLTNKQLEINKRKLDDLIGDLKKLSEEEFKNAKDSIGKYNGESIREFISTNIKTKICNDFSDFINSIMADVKASIDPIIEYRKGIEGCVNSASGVIEREINSFNEVKKIEEYAENIYTNELLKNLDLINSNARKLIESGGAILQNYLESPLENLIPPRKDKETDKEYCERIWPAVPSGTDEIQQIKDFLKRLKEGVYEVLRHAMRTHLPDINLRDELQPPLQLIRAWAEAPKAPNIDINRRMLSYNFDFTNKKIDTFNATAFFNRAAGGALDAIGSALPFEGIADRLLPAFKVSNLDFKFDLGDLLPDFAGLKLKDLLPDREIPTSGGNYDWVKIRHGIDKKRRTAWGECIIDLEFGDAPLFNGELPVSVRIESAQLDAYGRIEANPNDKVTFVRRGKLHADIKFYFGSQLLITIKSATIRYNEESKLEFDIDPNNIEFAPAVTWATELLDSFTMGDGFPVRIYPYKGGVAADLEIAIPPLTFGAFSITGLLLTSQISIGLINGFTLGYAFWLGKADRPFALTISFLGGGGWFGMETSLSTSRTVATVDAAIAAGAELAINLGFAKGQAFVYFFLNMRYSYDNSGGSNLNVALGVIIGGNLRILGIVSIELRIKLQISYQSDGSVQGSGSVSLKIKICWFVTLTVRKSVRYKLAGNGGSQGGDTAALASQNQPTRVGFDGSSVPRPAFALMAGDAPGRGAVSSAHQESDEIERIRKAVEGYFEIIDYEGEGTNDDNRVTARA